MPRAKTNRIAISVVTRNYLFQAKVLNTSLTTHHKDLRHAILIVDQAEHETTPTADESTVFVPLRSVVPSSAARTSITFRYNPLELCCALKPVFAAWALTNMAPEVVYLDGDTELVSRLPEDAWPGPSASIVLTPHCLRPAAPEAELGFLHFGTFNAGFFGVKDSSAGHAFLKHWSAQCEAHALEELAWDQRWLNLVPAHFPADLRVARDASLNVGYWNFHERGAHNLSLLHWSRLRTFPALDLANYGEGFRARWSDPLRREIEALARRYADAVSREMARDPHPPAYGFGTFSDGTPITREHRREFSHGSLRHLENPFDSGAEFRAAARSPRKAQRLSTLRSLPWRALRWLAPVFRS